MNLATRFTCDFRDLRDSSQRLTDVHHPAASKVCVIFYQNHIEEWAVSTPEGITGRDTERLATIHRYSLGAQRQKASQVGTQKGRINLRKRLFVLNARRHHR